MNNTCSCLKCGETPTRKKMMKKKGRENKREKQPSTRQNDNEFSVEIKTKTDLRSGRRCTIRIIGVRLIVTSVFTFLDAEKQY